VGKRFLLAQPREARDHIASLTVNALAASRRRLIQIAF
jgi:hypothetical protein